MEADHDSTSACGTLIKEVSTSAIEGTTGESDQDMENIPPVSEASPPPPYMTLAPNHLLHRHPSPSFAPSPHHLLSLFTQLLHTTTNLKIQAKTLLDMRFQWADMCFVLALHSKTKFR